MFAGYWPTTFYLLEALYDIGLRRGDVVPVSNLYGTAYLNTEDEEESRKRQEFA